MILTVPGQKPNFGYLAKTTVPFVKFTAICMDGSSPMIRPRPETENLTQISNCN